MSERAQPGYSDGHDCAADPRDSATPTVAEAARDEGRVEQLHHALEHAAHVLPIQGPIGVFVHHNTLHAFEQLPFEEAVVRAAQLFGAEPYMSEADYRAELALYGALPVSVMLLGLMVFWQAAPLLQGLIWIMNTVGDVSGGLGR